MTRCLESVIANLKWGITLEHIIVDDGSKDDTPAIIQHYLKQYHHIRFIKFDQNRGTNAARNAAISAARGAYCIFLDSDDYFVFNAISIINNIVETFKYLHYCFAPNDMMDYYRCNPLTKSEKTCELKYEDFLYERIIGDFIHVIFTETLKKFPFDEELRIYEGVFFKRFYREAGRLLFVPQVVTIRERDRSDSVTRDVLLRDKRTIFKGLKSKELLMNWFEDDLMSHPDGRIIVSKTLLSIMELNLLLGNYEEAFCCNKRIRSMNIETTPIYLEIIRKLHLGWLYYFFRKMYVVIRYDVLKSKLS